MHARMQMIHMLPIYFPSSQLIIPLDSFIDKNIAKSFISE